MTDNVHITIADDGEICIERRYQFVLSLHPDGNHGYTLWDVAQQKWVAGKYDISKEFPHDLLAVLTQTKPQTGAEKSFAELVKIKDAFTPVKTYPLSVLDEDDD